MGTGIDYEMVFRSSPSPAALLATDLTVADANLAYLEVSGRSLDEMLGRPILELFPDNPGDPGASGTRQLQASLDRVLASGQRDSMALQRYDVEVPGRPGEFEERYWSPVNAPVLGDDGAVRLIIHRVVEVTALVRSRLPGRLPSGAHGALSREDAMAAELLNRSQELQDLNEELRRAHARDQEVAIGLQNAMLPVIPEALATTSAVRYRPAASSLNVCGDWYDLTELEPGHVAVAVGDVVGHGLEAAGVMGQLRSALSAAIRATGRPAGALKTLALHALTVEGALATTAVLAVVHRDRGAIDYSCAGHPPPLLARADGTVDVLDAATDPPLGAWGDESPRAQAAARFRAGDTLVLYTDGLIERRGEEIDTGLQRLVDSLARHHALPPEPLADALLDDLATGDGGRPDDDIALVVTRL